MAEKKQLKPKKYLERELPKTGDISDGNNVSLNAIRARREASTNEELYHLRRQRSVTSGLDPVTGHDRKRKLKKQATLDIVSDDKLMDQLVEEVMQNDLETVYEYGQELMKEKIDNHAERRLEMQGLRDYIDGNRSYVHNNKGREKQNEINKNHYIRLLSMCMEPLDKGLSFDNVVSAIGMYAGMCLVNKDFKRESRKMIGETANKYLDAIADVTNNKIKLTPLRRVVDNFAKSEGRIPATPETAALEKLSIMQQTYDMIREPGLTDNEKAEIMQLHSDAISSLHEAVAIDGVDVEDINKEMRNLIGRSEILDRTNEYGTDNLPNMSQWFNETAYGQAYRTKSENREFYSKDKYGKSTVTNVSYWDGGYIDADTGKAFEGEFTLRMPLDAYGLANASFNLTQKALSDCKTHDEVFEKLSFAEKLAEMNDVEFHNNVFFSNMRDDTDFVYNGEVRNDLRDMVKLRELMSTAYHDGMNPKDIISVCDNSMLAAYDTVMVANPDMAVSKISLSDSVEDLSAKVAYVEDLAKRHDAPGYRNKVLSSSFKNLLMDDPNLMMDYALSSNRFGVEAFEGMMIDEAESIYKDCDTWDSFVKTHEDLLSDKPMYSKDSNGELSDVEKHARALDVVGSRLVSYGINLSDVERVRDSSVDKAWVSALENNPELLKDGLYKAKTADEFCDVLLTASAMSEHMQDKDKFKAAAVSTYATDVVKQHPDWRQVYEARYAASKTSVDYSKQVSVDESNLDNQPQAQSEQPQFM